MAIILDGTAGETFSGTGMRITGDFSNATVANRVMFQTSTVNSATRVEAIPNGTGTTCNLAAYNNSDPTNAAAARLTATSLDARVESIITGTGTYLPMTFYTGGSERVRISTTGSVGIGTNNPLGLIDAIRQSGTNTAWYRFAGDTRSSPPWTGTAAQGLMIGQNRTVGTDNVSFAWGTGQTATASLTFDTWDGTTYTERMRIDSSGNVGIGIAPASKFQVANGYLRSSDGTGAYYFDFGRNGVDGYFTFTSSQGLGYKFNGGDVTQNSAAGLGYGTGSGGTVTQATSKSTAVTLNKPTGQITMNNAALAANTAVQFTLNNSLITGNDVLNICFGPSAMTPSAYTLSVQTGTGVANIVLRNHSAGSLSEAVIINFAIIKGATS